MKVSPVLKYATILLILAQILFFCSEKEEGLGGDVPYEPCPCDNGEAELMEQQYQIPEGAALLFKDSIPEQMKYDYKILYRLYILFDSKTNNAHLIVRSGSGYPNRMGIICNFPDFAKKWDIPENGCLVYIKGLNYQSCMPEEEITTDRPFEHYNPAFYVGNDRFDYILSRLKKIEIQM